MPKEKRVILFLVEGPTDETMLIPPFKSIFDDNRVDSEALHCDVTTVRLFRDNAHFRVFDDVRETVRQKIIDYLDGNRGYGWKDIERIIHVVDLDGAFVSDDHVVEVPDKQSISYESNCIKTSNKTWVCRRNTEKAAALKRLAQTRSLKYKQKPVRYDTYFMSRNLEHALVGIEQELTPDQKEKLAQLFKRQYATDIEAFLGLLRSEKVAVPGNLQETWRFAQQGTHSLKRGSNIHLAIDEKPLI